jgi:ribosome biogenesis GTPase
MVRDGGAEPLILLTKTDLVEPAVLAGQLAEISAAGIAAPVLTLSNVTHEGLDAFQRVLQPGKTYCFVGSSGVGKSTLINYLSGEDFLDTQEVSETGEGRHTTVRRELICLESGAQVIDNPGMREFGVFSTDIGIENGYSGIAEFAASCRYRDCGHTNEPGCAVLAAVASGKLNRELHTNYLKLREESEFYQLSYFEKRRKDRSFGRFLKSAKKDFEDE